MCITCLFDDPCFCHKLSTCNSLYARISQCATEVYTKARAVLTANLRTKILVFRGSDSSRVLSLRGDIPRPIGDFPESLSQAILVGVILVGVLGAQLFMLA